MDEEERRSEITDKSLLSLLFISVANISNKMIVVYLWINVMIPDIVTWEAVSAYHYHFLYLLSVISTFDLCQWLFSFSNNGTRWWWRYLSLFSLNSRNISMNSLNARNNERFSFTFLSIPSLVSTFPLYGLPLPTW